jgi:hypothetical protein
MYHSELAKLGLVAAKILSEPQDSQFPNKPRWVAMEINGEERYYNCESVACEDALRGLKGQHVSIEAQGTREDAILNISQVVTKEGEKPKAANGKVDSKPAGATSEKLEEYADHSLRLFNLGWTRSAAWAKTAMPERDAQELTLERWYDLRMRVAQHIAIEIAKIIRKERF